ncbi:hypothetical protein B5K06_33500 [Rhizobium grahamii]|uniref:Uncharacterized protein n=1 Tax=Rhizobium grahamii TaxID=1120045 RepID=A0A370KE95_9HYPH|nr:hypothetical protein B5K06_33500 [Rhizobium grahamii]
MGSAGPVFPLPSKGVVGNIPLTKILPNMANYNPELGETVFGKLHGGSAGAMLVCLQAER